MSECISLKIPSRPEYVSLARLNSSAVANSVGFDFEEIDDIKIAVAEACNSIIDGLDGIKDSINIEYLIEDMKLDIIITTNHPIDCHLKEGDDVLDQNLSLLIIETIMDEVECLKDEVSGIKMTKRIGVDA